MSVFGAFLQNAVVHKDFRTVYVALKRYYTNNHKIFLITRYILRVLKPSWKGSALKWAAHDAEMQK